MQNEMRSMLIKAFDEWGLNQYIPFHTEREMLADYLVANGAIVLPCKVTDTVYVITTKIPCHACISCTDFCHKECLYPDRGNLVVKTATVHSIEIGEICKLCVEIEEGKFTHSYDYTYWFCDIGTTIFLTHEEAEKALKKRSKE